MEEFYPFFLIILASVLFSMVVRRMHVPWVVGLIIGGVIVGPHALGLLDSTPTADFLAQIGLIFLMFMAGLESRVSDFRKFKGRLLWLSFVNGAVPFVVGLIVASLFDYGLVSSLLVGIIFMSSSIAVVIPSLERNNLLHTHLGQSVIVTSVIQDIASLVLLSIVLQNINPVTNIPLLVFYPLVVVLLVVLRFVLPRINGFITLGLDNTRDIFQQEFRAVFLMLVGTVVVFELLGLHPIIAGFFAGLVLSDSIRSDGLKDKIRTIGYGVFIPTFFVLIGVQTDVQTLFEAQGALLLAGVIVVSSVASKFLSGWLGAKMVGFTSDQALLFAVSSIPQLSTTLAVAFTALSLGYIDQRLITAMVALSVVTVMVSPILMNMLGERIRQVS